MAKITPQVDNWYQDVQEDVLFEVVAVDEQEGYIEIQYENGEIGEFDFDTWKQMVVLNAQAPEDWRAAYEMSDDYDAPGGAGFSVANWDDPQARVEAVTPLGNDDF